MRQPKHHKQIEACRFNPVTWVYTYTWTCGCVTEQHKDWGWETSLVRCPKSRIQHERQTASESQREIAMGL